VAHYTDIRKKLKQANQMLGHSHERFGVKHKAKSDIF